jgi:hypothetical protein
VSLQDFTLGKSFCFLPLIAILESSPNMSFSKTENRKVKQVLSFSWHQ